MSAGARSRPATTWVLGGAVHVLRSGQDQVAVLCNDIAIRQHLVYSCPVRDCTVAAKKNALKQLAYESKTAFNAYFGL